MDTNRELRSMIFSTIHLPPLPAIVSRLDRDDNAVIDDEATESSHSIIGSMMEWAAMANNEKANSQRLLAQTELLNRFKDELSNMDLETCSREALFDFYSNHTRQWLNTYSTVGNMLRFKPLHYVARNDKTHKNMMGYTKAQYRLYTGRAPENGTLEDDYSDLLRLCAKWTKASLACNKEEIIDTSVANKELLFSNDETHVDQNQLAKNEANEGEGICAWVANDPNDGVELIRS